MAQTTKERIIERYNHAIDCIIDAYELGSNFQLNDAMNKIDLAATSIYQSLEWFLKKYLIDLFPDRLTNPSEYSIIEGTNFHYKVDLFARFATPSVLSLQLNLDSIKSLKQSVRNNPEHSGLVPHFDSLKIVITETHKILKNYLSNDGDLKTLPDQFKLQIPEIENWSEFFAVMDKFEDGRNYVLVTSSNLQSFKDALRPLGLIDWNFVFDFDEKSITNGIFKFISPELKSRRVIHQFVLNDPIIDFASDGATYWIFSNGVDGRVSTTFSTYRDWNRNYSAYIGRIISKFQADLSERPTTVLFFLDSFNYANELARLFYNYLGASVKFVFASSALSISNGIIETYEGTEVDISVPHISNGILQFKNYFNPSIQEDVITIPHKDNGFAEIKNEDCLWLEEDFILVHKNIIDNKIANYDFAKKAVFYKGGEIDWGGLHFNLDIRRDVYAELKSKVERKIRDRVASKFNIFHYPGIGGTTISKRLAWDLHKTYPVAVLKKFRKTDTINRVYKMYQISSLPPVIIIDSSKIDEAELDLFYSELLQRNFPCIFINVQRHSGSNISPTKESVFVSEVLSDVELASFVSIFSDLAPEKRNELKIILSSSESKKRHPFYLGLIAFEKEFENLQVFIKKAIDGSSTIQKKILAYISFCDMYAQRPISAQVFTGLLMLPESTVIRLEKVLSPAQIYLLSNEKSIEWTALHYLIAKQILLELYGNGGNENLLKNALSTLSIEFIELLASKSYSLSEDELDILNQLFISRGIDKEIEGVEEGHFSKLISDGIADDSSRLRIFQKLTEVLPGYSHFWSHLARFYNFKVKDSDKALEAIEKAIQIEEHFENNDSTLYHIKGMILRSKLRRLSNKYDLVSSDKNLINTEIKNLFEESSISFEKSREINPKDEYGYISNIELIISYLDFKFKISKQDERSVFLSKLSSFDLQALEKAEELLDEVKTIKIGQEDGFYIRRCSGQISEYYADYNTIIQNWNSLLDASKGYPRESVRRQIVRAYVSRAKGWENLNPRETERILQLIEENISEDANSTQNILLWFRTARTSDRISINEAIEKVARWRILRQTLESNYYLTCLHVILAIQGDSLSKVKAEQLLRETSEMSRVNINRAYCQDWLGNARNLMAFVSTKDGISRDNNYDIVFNKDLLLRIKARIVEIKGPEAGTLELECGLKVFFIPARAFKGEGAVRDRHLNEPIDFYLGFSYDGLRGFDINYLKV